MNKRSLAIAGGTAAALGVGVAALGLGTIAVSLVRAALGTDLAVDDGPDELLSVPTAQPARSVVATRDDTLLNVERYGPAVEDTDGDIVVLVHGWTCSTTFWYPQINHLAATRPVVAYDQRGHGASELGRLRPTIALLGQDLDAVLREVVPEGRRAVLVGHSMGGMTIMSWAAQFPDRVVSTVSGVVLTSTAARAVTSNHLLIPVDLPRYTKPFEPTVAKLFTSTPVPLPHNAYSSRLSQYIALGPHARKAHVDFVDGLIATCPPRSRAGWGAAMGKLDVVAGLEALQVPTTVVVGTADRLTPCSHAEQMAEVLQRNGNLRDLVIYDGVGHMSTIEAAVEYNKLLDDVLADSARPADELSPTHSLVE
ncbi:alpha/beta fold hydrolase [Gordonia sp. NPDC003424]